MTTATPQFELGDEVREALRGGRPVVALESTIIAHGFPYPDNLDMALAVEEEVRRAGAVPATVAVLDGCLRVGLNRAELERVAKSPDLPKASIRDLPVLCALGRSAATTVASTAQVAAWAGIDVFVTGGIGGVHRGWGQTFDISADLPALARLSLVVVSAGAKTVLDVAATLEYLETHGVTVLGYRTGEFPGFYLRSTGLPVDARIESAAEAAAVLRARRALGLPGAVLVANPIPPEDALDPEAFAGWLAQAEADLAAEGVKGKAVTPFLLARLHGLSGGRTVAANRALVLNNARLGAAIAAALAGTANGGPAAGEKAVPAGGRAGGRPGGRPAVR
ncbi:pseudouridine-5'-phosphate glycosidase [Thermaerobacter litoralis]